ncbi:MAG: DUF4870 domain-containing protein [Halorhodospira sp.]
MSEDMNDKSSKKTSETSKGSTSKAEGSTSKAQGSTSKAASSKTESAKAGTVETAAEQSSTSKGKGGGSSSAAASGGSSASSSSTASSGSSQDSGTQGSGEVFIGNSGLPRHFAAGLSYVLGPITAVIFLLLDRADPFVRFHAAQSLAISAVIAVIWIGVAILNAVFAGMPLVFWLGLIGLLYMAFTAYQSKDWEVPVVGDYSQKIADKVASESDGQ